MWRRQALELYEAPHFRIADRPQMAATTLKIKAATLPALLFCRRVSCRYRFKTLRPHPEIAEAHAFRGRQIDKNANMTPTASECLGAE